MNNSFSQTSKTSVNLIGEKQKRGPFRKKSNLSEYSTQISSQRLSFGEISILEESVYDIRSSQNHSFKKPEKKQAACVVETKQMKNNKTLNLQCQEKIKNKIDVENLLYCRNEITELQLIQKRTQDLVIKEKQQRKQIKKLKKLLNQKDQQLKQKQQVYIYKSNQLDTKIQNLQAKQLIIVRQKESIIEQLNELQKQMTKTKQDLFQIESQRQKLLRHIQLLEANCQAQFQQRNHNHLQNKTYGSRFEQIINGISQMQQINTQIQIIDRQILKSRQQPNSNIKLQNLVRLYQLRKQYSNKRQNLHVDKQRKRYQKIIFKLNRVLVSRNEQIIKQQQKYNQSNIFLKQQSLQDKQNISAETSDSFFAFKQNTNDPLSVSRIFQVNKDASENYSIQFQTQISEIIKSNRIKDSADIYEAIQTLVLNLLSLSQKQSIYKQSIPIITTAVDDITKFIVQKAHKNYQKIQNMMLFINNQSTSKIFLDSKKGIK